MKGLNNKGFAITTVLYSLLVMATLVLFLLIGNLSFERRSTDDFVSNIEDELNNFAGSNIPNSDDDEEISDDQYIKVFDSSGNFLRYATYADNTYIKQTDIISFRTALNTNYVIDVASNVNANGTNIQLYEANGSTAQKFTIKLNTVSSNYYNIFKTDANSMVFDILYGSSTDSTNIQLYTLNNGNGQMYRLIDSGQNGYYYIKSALNTCVDVHGGSVANSTNINSYTCNKTDAQKWLITLES